MKKALNVKQMVNTYLWSWDQMPETWETFYKMMNLGFISYDEWEKFFSKCHSWVFEREKCRVVDMNTGEVIKTF